MEKKWLGNVKTHVLTMREAINAVSNQLENKEKSIVSFINNHGYNLAQQDEEFRNAINSSHLILNDGIGIEIGAKVFDFEYKANLNGTDFIPALFQHFHDNNQTHKVYLLGAKPGIAELAMERLQRQYKNVEFVGAHTGYFDHNNCDDIIQEINSKKPDILLVGFGMPRQEKWIAKNREKLSCTVTFSVGGLIDFCSGTVKRAPLMYRKLRMEWLYRMAQDPKRLWKRNFIGHPVFFYNLMKQKTTLNKTN